MIRARHPLLLAFALATACDAEAPDCASICYEIVTYGIDATGGSGGDPECEGLTSESCGEYCELTIGGDAAVLAACDECVRGGDNYCGSWSCDDECGGFVDAAVRGDASCYEDADGDGYGTGPATTVPEGCLGGESAQDGDCDDADGSVNPGAAETADDGVDQDCTGGDATTCYADVDGDNYGAGEGRLAEGGCTEAEASEAGDCDDTDPSAFPGAEETADDGVDQDCNGADTVTCYWDEDHDGYGSYAMLEASGECWADFYSDEDGDCDTDDPAVNPGAVEVAGNGIDDDCDGETDE